MADHGKVILSSSGTTFRKIGSIVEENYYIGSFEVVCEGSRQGDGAPWCDAETLVPGSEGRWRLILDADEYSLPSQPSPTL